MSGAIFINYRSEDGGSYGLLLYMELSRHFGPDQVFLDSVCIPAGADYVAELLYRVRRARVLLAVVGPHWLTTDQRGQRRIDDPHDWVHREIVEAFAVGATVIPVLIDGAQPLAPENLPADIAALGRCQYRWLRHRDAVTDLDRIRADLAAAVPQLAAASQLRSSRGQLADPVSPQALTTRLAQLPADTSNFTGRAHEVAQLVALDSANRSGASRTGIVAVYSIEGMAGVGKTALAIHAGHKLARWFPDGCLFLDLHGHTEGVAPVAPARALARLLLALGVPSEQVPDDLDDRAALYRNLLADRRMLIVLDNARTAEQVQSLLPAACGSVVIVTSRRRLAALDEAQSLNLDVLPGADAYALFARAAGAHRAMDDAETVKRIVQICGYLPLALRIAAARLRARTAWTLREFAARLDGQRAALSELDDGERSVAAAFNLSYRDLTGEQQRMLRRLGLHPGVDIDQYAAAALAGAALDQTNRLLEDLVDAHLLQQTVTGRYRFHDLTRAFAIHVADSDDSADDTRVALTRLFDHYLAAVAAALDALHSTDAERRPRVPWCSSPMPPMADYAAALAWLYVERPNIVAACAYTAAHGWPAHTNRLATTYVRHLGIGGYYTDAVAVCAHARHAAAALGDRAAEAHAVASGGRVHWGQGRYGQAAHDLEQALTLYRETGDRAGEARTLSNLGAIQRRLGNYSRARPCFQQAFALARETGSQAGEARALAHLGGIHRRQGRYLPAANHYTRAFALSCQAGDRAGQAHVLHSLGILRGRHADYRQATGQYERALAIYRQTGHRAGEAHVLTDLGIICMRQGHYDLAEEYHRNALDLFRRAGDRGGEAEVLNGLGELFHASGSDVRASAEHAVALTLAVKSGDFTEQARAHAGLGLAHRALSDDDQAQRHWQSAFDLYTSLGAPEAPTFAVTCQHPVVPDQPEWHDVGSASGRLRSTETATPG